MQQGVGVSAIASYVAMTRVKRREDLIIYRPFDRQVFSSGPPKGPMLLLQHLRGEAVDWAEVENKLGPSCRCVGCGVRKGKKEYSGSEGKVKEGRWCKDCFVEHSAEGTKLLCSRCSRWCEEERLSAHILRWGRKRICKECVGVETRRCSRCQRNLCETTFGANWEADEEVRI